MTEWARLGVNLDHVATVRQARDTSYPDPLQAAFAASDAGADGITLHLREDRRHIQDRDVARVREHVRARLNLEMAATDEMVAIAGDLGPDDCCVVPERRAELTTEGGLDVVGDERRLSAVCRQLAQKGINVALFVDADRAQIEAAVRCGAAAVEIHTGSYADARDVETRQRELASVARALEYARACGLRPHAGHGLDYHNVEPIAGVTAVRELNIGHAIVARAVMTGLPRAVRDMKRLIQSAHERAHGRHPSG